MDSIHLRSTIPEKDFTAIAPLFACQEEEPVSVEELCKDYQTHTQQLVCMLTAEDEQDTLLGFTWAWHEKVDPERISFYLVVRPGSRLQGVGRLLYLDMARAAAEAGAKALRTSLLDTCPEGRAFVDRHGFSELRHTIAMQLDLQTFDDTPYDGILERLKDQGFQFTSMAELGDTEDARRKLYALNDAAVVATMGQAGEHTWSSFEDFQERVCGSEWYHPDGQMLAINANTGDWAAMSAITRMAGKDHAYNLFTGVDLPYRGRKLGQAVKVLALRYAREILQVQTVRTHHNTKNQPMLAIDRKFGYTQLPGTFQMEKKMG
jgi:GNAT superfamily N-acetyltransferase